jgi:hypothetical protein
VLVEAEKPLTAEPPMGENAPPLTSEPPLAAELPLTSEPSVEGFGSAAPGTWSESWPQM